MKKSILLLALIVVFSSCNGTKKTAEVTITDIPSGTYQMRSIMGAPVYKMTFDVDASENKISGKTNCNTYSGNYSLANNEFNFGSIISTKMYCEEHVMKEEQNLFKSFGNATNFVFDNDMLTLSSEEGILIQAYRLVKN